MGGSYTPPSGGGGGGTDDHTLLSNRDAADQHPVSAITELGNLLLVNYPIGDGATAVNVTSGDTYDLITGGLGLTPETVVSAGPLPNAVVTLTPGDHTGKVAIGAWSIALDDEVAIPPGNIYGLIVRYSGVTGDAFITFSVEQSGVLVPGGTMDPNTGTPATGDPWDGSAFALVGGTSGVSVLYFDSPIPTGSGSFRLVASLSGGPGTMTDPVAATVASVQYIPFPVLRASAAADPLGGTPTLTAAINISHPTALGTIVSGQGIQRDFAMTFVLNCAGTMEADPGEPLVNVEFSSPLIGYGALAVHITPWSAFDDAAAYELAATYPVGYVETYGGGGISGFDIIAGPDGIPFTTLVSFSWAVTVVPIPTV